MQKRRSKKYKKIFFCLFFSMVIVLAGFQVSAEELNDTQKEVWKTVENCWENFTKSDLNAVMAGIHADSLEWWATKPIPLNKKGMEPSYKAFLSSKPETYELEPLSIHIFGNIANTYYLYKFKRAGSPDPIRGRMLQTYIKQDNKWLFIGGMTAPCKRLPKCE